MGFLLGIAYLIYIVFAMIWVVAVQKKFKRTPLTLFVLFMVVMIPGWDIIITNLLGLYYCKFAAPQVQTHIEKKIEFPESVYFVDNVNGGFNEADRKRMIGNYLDGVHLKRMVLNGDDGKIYVYEADENSFKSFEYDKKYRNRYEQYAAIIVQSQKVYATKAQVPTTNYTVKRDRIALSAFAAQFLRGSKTDFVRNKDGNSVAVDLGFVRFGYWIFPDKWFSGRVATGFCSRNIDYSDVFQKDALFQNTSFRF